MIMISIKQCTIWALNVMETSLGQEFERSILMCSGHGDTFVNSAHIDWTKFHVNSLSMGIPHSYPYETQ